MLLITRYGRRISMIFTASLLIAAFVCFFSIPFIEDELNENKVSYYSVRINGNEVGNSNSREDAREALSIARKRLSNLYTEAVYMDIKFELVKESRSFSKRQSVNSLADSIYSELFSCIEDMEKRFAYTVRIGDNQISLDNKNDVVELFKKVIGRYDDTQLFEPVFVNTDVSGVYGISVEKKVSSNSSKDILTAILNGETTSTNSEGELSHDGIVSISFLEEVSVYETLTSETEVVSVEEAFSRIIGEDKIVSDYYVKKGDTLRNISEKFGMTLEKLFELNEMGDVYELDSEEVVAEYEDGGESSEAVLGMRYFDVVPGDVIKVEIPDNILSVVVVRKKTEEGEYSAVPEYTFDYGEDREINYISSEGHTGTRKTVTEYKYISDVLDSSVIVEQQIFEEAKPDIIHVGTSIESDFEKPVAGHLSRIYGTTDNGDMHYGIDWECLQNTGVIAAGDGVVVRAGWYGVYGYCVDIMHEDNIITRYAHLSSINVNQGQNVKKGQDVGIVGNTGEASGTILHFEMLKDGGNLNPLNYINVK